jgi:hypothetical protein
MRTRTRPIAIGMVIGWVAAAVTLFILGGTSALPAIVGTDAGCAVTILIVSRLR